MTAPQPAVGAKPARIPAVRCHDLSSLGAPCHGGGATSLAGFHKERP